MDSTPCAPSARWCGPYAQPLLKAKTRAGAYSATALEPDTGGTSVAGLRARSRSNAGPRLWPQPKFLDISTGQPDVLFDCRNEARCDCVHLYLLRHRAAQPQPKVWAPLGPPCDAHPSTYLRGALRARLKLCRHQQSCHRPRPQARPQPPHTCPPHQTLHTLLLSPLAQQTAAVHMHVYTRVCRAQHGPNSVHASVPGRPPAHTLTASSIPGQPGPRWFELFARECGGRAPSSICMADTRAARWVITHAHPPQRRCPPPRVRPLTCIPRPRNRPA